MSDGRASPVPGSPMERKAARHPDPCDWPLWWFSRLENALEASDFEAAAEAQQELERLGLRVGLVVPWAKPGLESEDD